MKRTVSLLFALMLSAGAAFAQDQQLGARTKAMGGSYTAFEDDPVSVWLNPAGIATQPDQAAISYQTYTAYPVKRERIAGDVVESKTEAETVLVDPALLPSYLGFVFQMGSPESPMAIGFCFARPYHLNYALDKVTDPTQKTFKPEANVEQSLSRFRVAFAKDFRFKKAGETGFLPHIAVGIGADIGFERWQFTEFSGVSLSGATTTDTSLGVGFGAGLLVNVFDNGESLKVNLGVAYQSFVKYSFDVEPDIFPGFDMPMQLNAGLTLYLLSGTPLRVTFDFQWIDWSATAEDPLFSNHPGFEDAINLSAGAEYRIRLSEQISLYPRAGYRRFDAPWDDEKNLPMTGGFKLVLDTKNEAFHIFTFGLGLGWTTEGGKLRSLDLAGDVGGDSFNVALGYTHEF